MKESQKANKEFTRIFQVNPKNSQFFVDNRPNAIIQRKMISSLDRANSNILFNAIQCMVSDITVTNFQFGELSGSTSTIFHHVYFSDKDWWSIKIRKDGKVYKIVYFEIRGEGPYHDQGKYRFSVTDVASGYKMSDYCKWIKKNAPELLPYWTAYRAKATE